MTTRRFLADPADARVGVPRAAVRKLAAASWMLVSLAGLSACGGGDNPLGNPPVVANPGGTSGQKLSYVYYQKCINPIVVQPIAGAGTSNTCAASGCHGTGGTGGALKLVQAAAVVDLSNAANTPEAIRASAEMYKNYYSAQGSTVLGNPSQSLLLRKPLVQNVLHGGGLIFTNPQDPNVLRLQYWISRPVPEGQDEFSVAAGNAMFTPPDATTGVCNSL